MKTPLSDPTQSARTNHVDVTSLSTSVATSSKTSSDASGLVLGDAQAGQADLAKARAEIERKVLEEMDKRKTEEAAKEQAERDASSS